MSQDFNTKNIVKQYLTQQTKNSEPKTKRAQLQTL